MGEQQNLFEETKKILESKGKSLEDILWIGGKDFEIDKKQFMRIAGKTDYDCGFGGQEIATDLVLVGTDFWLERGEYDGSEWWEFKSLPTKPATKLEKLRTLNKGSWETLKKMQEEDGE